MSITVEDIKLAFEQNLTTGTNTKEGLLQDIINLFVGNFGEGIVKLMIIIIPIIVLFKILDFLFEFLRNPDRNVKDLLKVTTQTLLHYAIVLFLAEFWVKYLYQDMFILVTEKLPMEILNLQEPLTLDKTLRVFTAPFMVYGNILNQNSQELVTLIQNGASQGEINKLLYTEKWYAGFIKGAKVFVGAIFTGLSFLSDAVKSLVRPESAGDFLARGFAFVGTWLFIVKTLKLISTVLFAYLFAGLSIAVSLAMSTFHFLFTSEKIKGLSGGLSRILNIIINSIAKFSVLILFLELATSDIIPLSPIWTAQGIAIIQDSKKWAKNFNNPQTFYYMMGYWLFMLLFAKLLQESVEQIDIT